MTVVDLLAHNNTLRDEVQALRARANDAADELNATVAMNYRLRTRLAGARAHNGIDISQYCIGAFLLGVIVAWFLLVRQ